MLSNGNHVFCLWIETKDIPYSLSCFRIAKTFAKPDTDLEVVGLTMLGSKDPGYTTKLNKKRIKVGANGKVHFSDATVFTHIIESDLISPYEEDFRVDITDLEIHYSIERICEGERTYIRAKAQEYTPEGKYKKLIVSWNKAAISD